MVKERRIARVVARKQLHDVGSDFEYWQSRSPLERLAALDEIRREYHLWRYGGEQRMQCVARIVGPDGRLIRQIHGE
jgi:hypothetical protein